MTEISASAQASLERVPRLAVLVDGENISADAAGWVLKRAAAYGGHLVRRVYGDVSKLAKWQASGDFRLMHAGSGKNAADLLLTVEAMAFALSGQVDGVVLVSSDGDFTHLAIHLREAGHLVVGLGEQKAPATFRKACSSFEIRPAAAVVTLPATPLRSTLDRQICEEIRDSSDKNGVRITDLNVRIRHKYQIAISQCPEKTWRAYLLARPDLFLCDPKGPEARVRLRY